MRGRLLGILICTSVAACQPLPVPPRSSAAIGPESAVRQPKLSKSQKLIVEGARNQLSWGTIYDASYRQIAYPNGDVERSKGACTDVVIRSLRNAGIDLQSAIHKDMLSNWTTYPRYQGSPKPDPNIDQRRVPNQRVFFSRFGIVLTKNLNQVKNWQPGDIVEWRLPFGHDHTGILTDRVDGEGLPYVVHNIGPIPAEEDVLRNWPVTGHFRFPK